MRIKKINYSNIVKSLLFFLLVVFSVEAVAQNFGRNKIQYQRFKFNILQTQNFDIYNYVQNDTVARNFATLNERWYLRHSRILADTFTKRNPVIIYNNHADFQQTGLIDAIIGTGTGGVTEGFKNRVFMPFFDSNQQTDHVLGHEMVHAFQFNMLKGDDSLSLFNTSNIPLWMIEGMAEYLSIGRRDAHTAMWMRDAVVSNDFPTLLDLTRTNKYFPYRYGQAFWAYVAGVYGDEIIKPLFISTAKFGYQIAVDSVLGYEERVVSNMWKNRTFEAYEPLMKDTIPLVGRSLINDPKKGDLNISPVYSPDGKFFTYFSERNLFSVDLFLADATTGLPIRVLSSATERSHVDEYNYIESIGSWSPNSDQYVYVIFTKGKNSLVFVDIKTGKTISETTIPGVPYFNNPSWSPDGKQILVTGLVEGKSDLYLYDIQKKEVTQLTNDFHSEIHATWSSDGKKIVFSSDRGFDTNLSNLVYGSYKICIMDVDTRQIKVLDFFPKANNLNAQFSPDNSKIYFLSNGDGFRNLYEYILADGSINKLTKYFTGISGITEAAPAFSVSRSTGDIAYTLFRRGDYNIYTANSSEFPRFPVDPQTSDFTASELVPFVPTSESILAQNLLITNLPDEIQDNYVFVPYKPKFSLTTIGQTGIGVGTSQFGTQLQGGVSALFGDILNNNQVFSFLQVNGEIIDIGGQVVYLNRSGRLNWGAGFSHIPFLTSAVGFSLDTLSSPQGPILAERLDIFRIRTFVDDLSLFASYPISQTLRYEGGVSYSNYSYRVDRESFFTSGGFFLGQERQKLNPEDFNLRKFRLFNTQVAMVGDNSQFGLTSPVRGQRFRFQAQKTFGEVDIFSVTADFRRYIFFNPLTLAYRALYFGRFGNNNDLNRVGPLFLGSDFLVRGYNINSINDNLCPNNDCLTINELIGNQVAVGSIELRLPFTGPEKLAQVRSGFLFSDLGFFIDGGIALQDGEPSKFSLKPVTGVRTPIGSAGVTMRINLFGFAILEPYYALPFQRFNSKPTFGLFISGGGW